MSVTKAQLAEILSASNEQLFDRYINVKLLQDMPTATEQIAKTKQQIGSAEFAAGFLPASPLLEVTKEGFFIKTPSTGIKPHIAVTGKMQVSAAVTNITVTIYNISENIDTMAYNYAEVEVGYMNSGVHVTFIGQIINCYMAKPNPNGELVIAIACAPIVDLYARGDFEIRYSNDILTFTELITETVDAIQRESDGKMTSLISTDLMTTVPDAWKSQKFNVGKATRHYRSAFGCITWLNSLFASYTDNTGFAFGPGAAPIVNDAGEAVDVTGLSPILLGFDGQGYLRLKASFSDATAATMKAITCIGSAFLTGGASAGTVTAPFNPDILPGDVVYVDLKYFKTRVNVGEVRKTYSTMGNMWYVIENSFTFDTIGANTMTLLLNNTGNKISAGEG